jgi:hypothetical protein
MDAIYANGREMLSQAMTSASTGTAYIYADDAAPCCRGTILHFVAWYDNTPANRSNPDPDQWVGWGDRTIDEMGHAWINITYFGDAEFKAEVAKRSGQNVATTGAH